MSEKNIIPGCSIDEARDALDWEENQEHAPTEENPLNEIGDLHRQAAIIDSHKK